MLFPTANEYVALPDLAADGSLGSLNVLHMGLRGLVELVGEPLLRPHLRVDGADAWPETLRWQRLGGWIPQATGSAGGVTVTLTYLCPAGQRGLAVQLAVEAGRAAAVEWGAALCWAQTRHTINVSKPIEGSHHLYHSEWNQGPVLDVRLGVSLLALAPQVAEPGAVLRPGAPAAGAAPACEAWRSLRLQPGERATLTLFLGLGLEEVGAVAAARELQRTGYDQLLADTLRWLTERRPSCDDPAVQPVFELNLLFNRLFATGRTIDSEELVLVTSRSPRYYVSAAFWDRDALCWSLPALLLSDPACAREALQYYYRRQARGAGIHSRYIDGTVLEPGFELDELVAPLTAMAAYVEATGDMDVPGEVGFFRHAGEILRQLAGRRHPAVALYSTFLLPSDDVPEYPYCTYDNVLVWRALLDLAGLVRRAAALGLPLPPGLPDAAALAAHAADVAAAVRRHCVVPGPDGPLFAWEVDLNGHHRLYDEPPGSLQLLAPLGFCTEDDPVYRATVAYIRSPRAGYSFAGALFAELGCAHASHPWILAAANSLLLTDYRAAARDLLLRAEMDGGIACESIDEHTGRCATGAAFATCAGYLAYALHRAQRGPRPRAMALRPEEEIG